MRIAASAHRRPGHGSRVRDGVTPWPLGSPEREEGPARLAP